MNDFIKSLLNRIFFLILGLLAFYASFLILKSAINSYIFGFKVITGSIVPNFQSILRLFGNIILSSMFVFLVITIIIPFGYKLIKAVFTGHLE